MEQALFGGYHNSLHASTTEYNMIQGGFAWTATIGERNCPMPTTGSISGLLVKLSAAPGTGKSYAFTIMKNDAATDVTCTVSDTETEATDTAHSVSFEAGDTVCLRCVPTGTPALSYARWASIFTGDVDQESVLLGIAHNDSGAVYHSISGDGNAYTSVSNAARVSSPIPIAGTFKKLYVLRRSAPGVGESDTYSLSELATATALTCTVADANTTASDTTHTVSVDVGDCMCVEVAASTATEEYAQFGMVFVAGSTNASLLLGANNDALSSLGSTEYDNLVSGDGWTSTASSRNTCSKACKLGHFRGVTSQGPEGNCTFTIRQNSADTALSFTISDDDTTGTSDEWLDVADGDILAIKSSFTTNPVFNAYFVWGLAAYAPDETCYRVKVVPQDPYTVTIAGGDPYVVAIKPSDPYKVVIAPPEE